MVPSLNGSLLLGCLGGLVLLLLLPADAFPCSCIPSQSPCATVGTSTVVFVGTPIAVEELGSGFSGARRFRFRVEEPIQNIKAGTIDVTTPPDTAACGYPFKLGTKHLVYGARDGGMYHVSLCSRTGPLEARRNDLALLRQAAAGSVRPRLFGVIYRLQLRLDGFLSHHDTLGGVPNVPVRVTVRGRVRQVRTDRNGRYTFDGLPTGSYAIDLNLPSRYAPLYEKSIIARVDRCSGEASVAVATVPLRGTVRAAPGEHRPRQVMLRVAQLDAGGTVSFDRSTVAFTQPDGTWTLPGLPAGRYVLGVTTFGAPTRHTPYPTRWYPNAATPKDAVEIVVSDDGTVSIDFELPPRLPENKMPR